MALYEGEGWVWLGESALSVLTTLIGDFRNHWNKQVHFVFLANALCKRGNWKGQGGENPSPPIRFLF